MNIFEVLFVVLFLATLATLAWVGALFLSGRSRLAIRLFCRLALGVTIYLAVVLISSSLVSRTELKLGEPLCFDDWCITIESVNPNGTGLQVVSGSMSSRARGAPQRETGVVLYLTDSSGDIHSADYSEADTAFDIRLAPNESVGFSRTFRLAAGKTPTGVVIAHDYGFPIDWFIIGYGPFKRSPIVRLQPDD